MTGDPSPAAASSSPLRNLAASPRRRCVKFLAFSSKDQADSTPLPSAPTRFEPRRSAADRARRLITDAGFDARARLEPISRLVPPGAPRRACAAATLIAKWVAERRATALLAALPALSAVRRSRLAAVNARVRARGPRGPPSSPRTAEDAREEAGGSLSRRRRIRVQPDATVEPPPRRRARRVGARSERWARMDRRERFAAKNAPTREEHGAGVVDSRCDLRPRPCATVSRTWKRRGVASVGAGSAATAGTEVKRKDERFAKTSPRWRHGAVSGVARRIWIAILRKRGGGASVAPARTVTCDGARCLWDPDAPSRAARRALGRSWPSRGGGAAETFRNRCGGGGDGGRRIAIFQKRARDAETDVANRLDRDWRRLVGGADAREGVAGSSAGAVSSARAEPSAAAAPGTLSGKFDRPLLRDTKLPTPSPPIFGAAGRRTTGASRRKVR